MRDLDSASCTPWTPPAAPAAGCAASPAARTARSPSPAASRNARPSAQALADARIGLRTASQLCTALEHVPDDLDDALVTAVLHDGIGRLLLEQTGGTPEDDDAAAAVLAQRAADPALLDACAADRTAAPAARRRTGVRAARRTPARRAARLSALRMLLDPLQPDGTDQPEHDPYYLELRILADGDVDLRGLLDPETGQSLAAEIERRLQARPHRSRQGPPDHRRPTAADDPTTRPTERRRRPAPSPPTGRRPERPERRRRPGTDARASRRPAAGAGTGRSPTPTPAPPDAPPAPTATSASPTAAPTPRRA